VRTDRPSKDQRLCELECELTLANARIEELEEACPDLNVSQNRLDAVFYEQAPFGYLALNGHDQIIGTNATAARMLAVEPNRLRNFLLKFFICREDLPIFLDHLSRCRRTVGEKAEAYLRLQSRTQQIIPVQLISVMTGKDGASSVEMIVVDLTGQNRNEQALAESKEVAESIVETVREPLAVLDADLRILSVNRAFTEFFQKTAKYIRDRPFDALLNLWWSGHRLRDELERVLLKNQPLENFELEVEIHGVGKRSLVLNARRLYQKPGAPGHLLVAMDDVTEKRQAEMQIRQINTELEQRVESRTEDLRKSYEQMESFCYSIAHDLRAPLRTMVGFSELLAEVYGSQIGVEGRDYTQRIRDSGKRMDNMILDLLNFGRLNTAHLPIEEIDLERILKDVLARHNQDIQNRQAMIEVRGPLPTARGHRVVLDVAFANLLSNALKFGPPGKTPQIRIWHDRNPTALKSKRIPVGEPHWTASSFSNSIRGTESLSRHDAVEKGAHSSGV